MEVIEFKKVYFSYETGEKDGGEEIFGSDSAFAVNGVDFTAREGEFIAILGHNGSGKSTLARLANGLLTPNDGEVTAFGLSTAEDKNLFEIRKQVGIVFQNPDNQTVASIVEDDIAFGPENVGIPREEIGERIEFALNAVGMQDFRHATPTRLSGGQKQRIAIAGVLALKPRVMILDEATAMLDPKGRREVMDVVLRLNKEEKITVIVITHFPEEALLADRAIVMSQGKIVMEGKPAEILSKGEELKKYSLTLPAPTRVCRALSEGGLAVQDAIDVSSVAENIALAIDEVNVENIKTNGAGTRSNRIYTQEGERGRVLCEHLSHVYNPSSAFETFALHDVSLEIQPRDFFGIIGHTGSGKSTFVQHLNALIKVPTAEKKYKAKKPKKGEAVPEKITLTVNGYDLTDKKTDFKALREKVGMVFQYPEYQLFAETVFEDVAFGLKNFKKNLTDAETEQAVREAIETVGLPYEQVKNRSPFELSGGQKRRVAIAGVIVTKPEILVLDEPAAGLDPLGKSEIMSLLHKLHEEWCTTVIIVSHDMDVIAENCNRAAIFSEGNTVAIGEPKRLFKDIAGMQALGLDVPFTAKLVKALKERNIEIECDYTFADFVDKTLQFAKKAGAGMRSNEGGGENA
ncbi:MAG: energy-coupling factor transporter ATPase [Clostridia bacterium]|nr:energy-coupling factor transporter ATPase [Clostridia bacterium]